MISVKINLTSKQKMALMSVLFIIIAAVVSIWIIVPVIKDIRNLNQQIYEQRLALERRYVQRFSMRRIIANFREIHENMNKILSIFLSQNDEITFITMIEEKADKNNMDLKIYFLPQEGETNGKQVFDLTLTVNGDFKNVVGFISDIEKFDTYILLNSVSLTQSAGDEKGVISASLKGYVYQNINL